ncbi:MAG: membrane protein insertase YidC [Bacteroidales bacterium]|nr:membrane protein insertase YidC [Bacteroidales bacterium]
MDKKSITGLVLICLIFLVFGWLNRPTEEQKAQIKRQQDSIAAVQKQQQAKQKQQDNNQTGDELQLIKQQLLSDHDNDSLKTELDNKIKNQFALFSNSAMKEEKHLLLENDVFTVDLSTLGGMVSQVTLKDYKTYYKKPVTFFTDKGNSYGLNISADHVVVPTQNLCFVPFVNGKIYDGTSALKVSGKDSLVVSMRLYPNKNDSLNISEEDYIKSSKSYIEYQYILRGNDYRLGFNIVLNNVQDIITDESQLEMDWKSDLRLKEKDIDIERKNSTLYYKLSDDVEYLKEQGRDDNKTETGIPLKWISYKQQFFSVALICNNKNSWFESANLRTQTEKQSSEDYMRTMSSNLTLAYDNSKKYTEYNMDFFFGPNKYNIIKKYKIDMERIIPLGWGFFLMQWVNRFVIIPVFDFLVGFGLNYGLIILILTLLVKIVLFPLAYKSFSSTAKMRVLQPEINKINEKYPKQDQMMQKQQAIQQLYRRAGINPMAGCLPMLIQFPILIAMFRFFPSSIELRQQPFLWADDLSTYDSIINLPFNIPFAGNHISLFCVLMTVAQLLYTKMTMNQQAQTNAMPGMKFMMYGMPIMMFFILNNFSAALNYYYLLSLFISVLQMFIIRRTINEQKILERLQKNSGKPMKKSKWQQRMEALEKQNRKLLEERQKNARRK